MAISVATNDVVARDEYNRSKLVEPSRDGDIPNYNYSQQHTKRHYQQLIKHLFVSNQEHIYTAMNIQCNSLIKNNLVHGEWSFRLALVVSGFNLCAWAGVLSMCG